MKLTKRHARKVLEVVDAGLIGGMGNPVPGQMCVEAAVCYALGLDHGDNPKCVGQQVRKFKIALNDSTWSSNKARAKGLRAVAIAQLGSNKINQIKFCDGVRLAVVNEILQKVLLADFKRSKNESILQFALHCQTAKTSVDCQEVVRDLYLSAGPSTNFISNSDCVYGSSLGNLVEMCATQYARNSKIKRNYILKMGADIAVRVLKKLKSPGCKWLDIL